MASAIPKPVTAAIGLLPTVLRSVRRLPTRAVQLPILVLSSALTGVDAAKREYEELAERGERTVAKLRGVSGERTEEALQDPAGTLAKRAGSAAGTAHRGQDAAANRGDELADTVRDDSPAATPDAAAKPESAVPAATSPARSPAAFVRVDTAATPEVVRSVEQATAGVTAPATATDLPLADYDHMTLGALRGRLRSLDVAQLAILRAYEKSKANRLPIITMLDNRIARLAAGGAAPTTTSTPAKAPAGQRPPRKLAAPSPPVPNTGPPHGKVRIT